MAINGTTTLPVANPTEDKTPALTGNLIEDGSPPAGIEPNFTLDLQATVNASPRLFARSRVVPEFKGSQFRLIYYELYFGASADQSYGGTKTTPFTDAEADPEANGQTYIKIGEGPWRDMQEFYTLAES